MKRASNIKDFERTYVERVAVAKVDGEHRCPGAEHARAQAVRAAEHEEASTLLLRSFVRVCVKCMRAKREKKKKKEEGWGMRGYAGVN